RVSIVVMGLRGFLAALLTGESEELAATHRAQDAHSNALSLTNEIGIPLFPCVTSASSRLAGFLGRFIASGNGRVLLGVSALPFSHVFGVGRHLTISPRQSLLGFRPQHRVPPRAGAVAAEQVRGLEGRLDPEPADCQRCHAVACPSVTAAK